MIEYCLERRLEPCWDAHNDISAALAAKLGFVEPAPYTAYEVRDEVTAGGGDTTAIAHLLNSDSG